MRSGRHGRPPIFPTGALLSRRNCNFTIANTLYYNQAAIYFFEYVFLCSYFCLVSFYQREKWCFGLLRGGEGTAGVGYDIQLPRQGV